MKVIEAIKRICDRADGDDIFWFVVLLLVFPPFTLIWLAIRIIQEMDME